jgi:FkbM family methyltransferase
VKDAIHRAGWRVQRYPRSAYLLDRLVTHPNFKFVQVGANDGVRFDRLYGLVTLARVPGVAIEPLPDVYARLRQNYSDYPNVMTVNAAVHATEKSMAIYRVDTSFAKEKNDWMGGIASFSRRHLENHGVPEGRILTEQVPCRPLMDILEDCNALDAMYLQTDTEGYDGEILRMIDFARFHPSLIKFEAEHLTSGEYELIVDLLRGHGYRVFRDGLDAFAHQRPCN